jgi:hypothetical protein
LREGDGHWAEPAFANSIALRTSSISSPLSRASATSVVLFLEPGLRPPLPNGRPRARECGCGLGFGRRFGPGFLLEAGGHDRNIRIHSLRRLRRTQTFLRMLGIEVTFSRQGWAGARMIRMSAARHGSANSAPRPHRDGRTAYTQCDRLVT